MRWRGPHLFFLAAAVTIAACGNGPEATLVLNTGAEIDAFSKAPAPTSLVIEGIDLDGKVEGLATVALPATEDIDLGDKGRTDVGAIRVTAFDGTGKVLLKGESLFVQFGALENRPFDVFVQRTGELARLPNPPATVIEAPMLGVTVARYILAVSGTTSFLYDLLQLQPISALPAFPRVPRSLATFGTAAIVIDDQGATIVDLSTGNPQELTPPAGATFGEVAGGATISAPDGSAYVVGGTRTTGGPSNRVLVVAKDGSVVFATLAMAREGACATFVEGRGLVVYGGTAADAKGGGAEVLLPGTVQGAPLPYPADAVKSCGAATLDASHVVVTGGTGSTSDVDGAAQTRVLDLACAAECKPAAWPGAIPLVRAEAFPLAFDAALVVGDDSMGASHAFRASAAGPREVPLKAPRRNARLIALPVKGTVAIVGGAAPIEQYVE